MGSSKKVTVGYRYYMGLHFGLCHGPVDDVYQVLVGDRDAWSGDLAGNGSLAINKKDLFGGDKREGGIVGTLDVMMGAPAQTENSYLAGQLGGAIPAFRGILSAVWRGGQVAANNPYVKPWAFRIKRILQGWSTGSAWYPGKAEIRRHGADCACFPVSATDVYAEDWPVLTQGVSPNYVSVGQLYPDSLTIGPFVYDAIIKAGYADGSGQALADDYFVFNGVTYSPGSPKSTPIAGGTTVYSLPAGQTLLVQCLNMLDPYTHASLVFTAFGQATPAAGTCIDMNPAHIVYQCLTDSAWGMGYPTSAIDSASFTAVADALYGEGFGLSFIWSQQETIENFIQMVLDHAGALLYVRPDTGTFALRLLRSDYDRSLLPLYGPESLISASDYQRQAWGETINEITVVYTAPCTGKDATVTAQDIANIQMQGGVVAQTRNYPGIRGAGLAQRVALRDLQAASTPLARIKLTATRVLWTVSPGDVFRLSWPEFDIADVVYRALAVNRGTLQNGEIIIDAVEDVFGLPDNTYLAEQPGEWVDPSADPVAAPYRKLLEAPYWDLARTLSAADLAYVDALSGYLETLAVRPSYDALNYGIQAKIGGAAYEAGGNGDFCPSATVVGALTKTTTALTLANGVDLDLVVAGGYAIIESEYVLVSAMDATAGTATIARGLLDTLPADHTAGSRIWFADGNQGFSSTEYADGETVDVKLLPLTGRGELDISLATSDSLTFDQRQYRPYPPGKLLVNTGAWPVWIDGFAELALAWAHRDRLSQTAYLVDHGAAGIGPEAGVSYTLSIYGETNSLIRTYSGISGESKTYTASEELADSLLGIPGGVGDPYWSYVKLLLHCNGANNSTTFTDSSGTPLTVTPVGNAKISTTQSKFGGASGAFDGTGDYLTLPTGSTWDVGTGNFTVEFFVYVVADNVNSSRLFQSANGDVYCGFYMTLTGGGKLSVAATSNGTTFNIFSWTQTAALSHNAWHHIAYVRNGTGFTVYVDGTGTLVATSSASIYYNAAHVPVIGGQSGTNRCLNGYIDELRFTKGIARYSGNFTPPAGPFNETAENRLNGLLRFELESVRGGLASYQKYNHTVLREGYGFNYGYYYGGQ